MRACAVAAGPIHEGARRSLEAAPAPGAQVRRGEVDAFEVETINREEVDGDFWDEVDVTQRSTLAILVKRLVEIRDFKPEEYYTLSCDFGDYKGLWFDPSVKEDKLASRIADSETAQDKVKKLKGKTGRVSDIVREETEDGEVKAGLILDYFQFDSYKGLFPTLTKYQVKHFIYQTLRTLSAAHSRGVVHRDIKPLNVLMNSKTNELRVIDWGLGDFYEPGVKYSTAVSTLYFMAPELLMEYRYHDYALDIWSTGLGVTI